MTDPIYNEADFGIIVERYGRLLGDGNAALDEFLDLDRTRDWSVLTSDFRNITFAQATAFHEEVVKLSDANRDAKAADLGARLAALARQSGIGFSLGLSPWTDSLLLKTFSDATRRVIIILGHDWYPIVTPTSSTGRYAAMSPLFRQCMESEYPAGIPAEFLNKRSCGVFFLNLYPDFRAPGGSTQGVTTARNFTKAFSACCEAIARNYEIACIVSWGSHVWDALRRNSRSLAGKTSEGIAAAALAGPHLLDINGVSHQYFPFTHPSSRGWFHGEKFKAQYGNIFENL